MRRVLDLIQSKNIPSFTMTHPQSNLLEMQINQGFGFSTFYSVLANKVVNTAMYFEYSCYFTKIETHPYEVYISEAEMSTFEIGETLFCAKDGWSCLVKITSLSIDSEGAVHILVVSTSGKKIAITREHLRPPENLDIDWIPSTVPEYRSTANVLTEEGLEKLVSPIH